MRILWVRSVIGVCICALSAHAAIHHSSGFGWTANHDVTTAFAELFSGGTVGSGDELILDHTYEITGTHELPDTFTLAAVTGAGFDLTDATPDNRRTNTADNSRR